MGFNDYDEAVEQLAPKPVANPYDDVIRAQDAGTQQRLRTSIAGTVDQGADAAADAQKIAASTNVPVDVVQRNLPAMRKRALIDATPFDQMLRDTPHLAEWAGEPVNAAVSHDDMDKLGALEWLVTMPSRAISQSLNEQAYGELRTKSLFQPLTQEEHDLLDSYKYNSTVGGELGSGNSWFRGALTQTMKLLTTLAAPESIPTAVGAAGGAIVGGAGGFLMGGVGAIPGALAGGKLGAEAGYAYGLGKSAFQTAAASSFDEYLELKDAVGRPLDPEVAKAAALVNGAVNAGLMTFGGKAIAAGMEAGGARVGQLLTKNAIKGALRQPSVAGAIAEMMKTYGTTLTEGTALMVAMKASDIIAGSIANATGDRAAVSGQLEPGTVDLFKQPAVRNADGSISTVDSFSVNIDGREVLLPTVTPDGRHLEQPAAIAEYEKTGRHLGIFDTPENATKFAEQLHEDYAAGKYTPPSVGRQLLTAAGQGLQSFSIIGLTGPAFGLAREVQRARRAKQGEAFFQALGEGVAQSKTAQRLPEGAQAFIERATKDGPIKSVYAPVEGWSKYWQDAGVDPAAMAAEVTGRPDALEQAETTGLLEIPTSRYATKLAATEHNGALSRILKLDPDAMNAEESEQLVADIEAGKHDQGTEQPAESPVRKAVLEQLERAKVTGPTAEAYADVYDAAFGTLAERAGVDPAELFAGYGLQVNRPDLAETPAPAGEAARPEATDVPVDGKGLPIVQSDYTGPERRAEGVQQAAGELRLRGTDEPIPAMALALEDVGRGADIARRAAEMRRENPDIDLQAKAMREKATKAGRIKEPADAAALRSGAKRIVDKKADAAQNPENYLNAEHTPDTRVAATAEEGAGSPDAQGQRARADEVGTEQGRGDGRGAQPGGTPAGIPELDETFKQQPAEHTDQRLTPEVERELRRVRDELDRSGHEGATWTWLTDEKGLEGNAAGGHANKRGGHGGAAVYHDVLAFSPMNMTTSGRNKGKPAERAHGDRAKVQRAIEQLLEERHVTNNLMEGALRVAENRNAGIYRDLSHPELPPSWGREVPAEFTDALSDAIDQAEEPAGNMLADAGLEQDAVDSAEGDTSFDITEFSQGLFDELEPPDPKLDTLADTGEHQARLPGDVGDVREQDVATPEFELPFSLTSEVGKPKKGGGQTSLFQGSRGEITQETLDGFSQSLKNVYGKDLARLDLALNHDGSIALEWIVVDRGAQRAGVGSKVMRDLTRIADVHGKRLELNVAGGGEDRARLVKFYEKFGFVENFGRHKDTSTFAMMYRDPSAIMGQPLFHGSPHDFERFSLEHVGTGEGAQSYGHGLYFAENPAVAAHYHDQLSEGRDVVTMKLGRMKLRAPDLDYTRNASLNDVENIRASIAEDLLASPLDLNAAGEAGFRDHVLAMVDQRIADYATEYPEGVAAAKKLRSELEKPGALAVEFTKTKGGVYQVDIPDTHIDRMIDYDAPLGEQSEAVKSYVREFLKEKGYLRKNDDGPRVLVSAFKSYVSDNLGMGEGHTGSAVYEIAKKWETEKTAGQELLKQLREGTAEEHAAAGHKMADLEDQAAKRASEALRAAGIPGLKYLDEGSRDTEGRKKTRNLVVFDDSIVTLTHKDGKPFTAAERKEFFQGEKPEQPADTAKRGVIRFGSDRQFSIDLLERADLSTFLHESGHFFLEVFGDLADKLQAIDPEQLTEAQRHMLSDYGQLLQSFGVENRADVGTAQHEQFARTFEAYLMKGEAPSAALRTPFARFRAWLVGIYQSLQKLNVRLTPEVTGVLDRMLASDQAIADAEAQRGVGAMFTTAEAAGMEPTEFALYARTIADASKDAREQLDRRLLSEVQREQTAEWKARRSEVKAEVEDGVYQRPEYRALAAMKNGTHPNGEPLVEGLETPALQLSRELLEARFGKDRIKRLPRGIVAAGEGVDPDLVASMFGYSSADEMLTAVEKAPRLKDVVEQETKRRMIEEHGSILLDGTLAERAQAATANETRDEVIRAEMRALGRKRREVGPFVKAERQKGEAALAESERERAYERRWFEAEARLRISIAEGHKQVEIDALTKDVQELRAKARGGAAVIRAAIPDAAVLRDAAAARVAAMKIGDVRPALYWTASRRAGEQAIERAARQDFDGAISAKQQELVNLNLYRQAEKALEDVEDRVRFAKSLSTPAARKAFGLAGGSYLDQVDGVLDRFEFARVPQKVLDRRAGLKEWIAGLKAQGLPADGIPEELLEGLGRTNYKDLTVEQLVGVTDGLKQIQHLARLKNRLLKAADAREFAVVRDGIAASIDRLPKRPKVLEFRSTDDARRRVGEFFASHTKLSMIVRSLDSHEDGGALWEALMRPVNAAGDAEVARKQADGTRFAAIIEAAYPGRELATLHEKLFLPELGASLSKEGRLAVALNWGNETSRNRLLNDPIRGWKEPQIKAILDTLDARDWKFVQDTFDFVNSYWDEIAAKQERVTGLKPEKVEALPITTKFGDIAGGYYPLAYDSRLSVRAGQHEMASQSQLAAAGNYVRSTTKRGHVEARKQNVRLPVRLELGVVFGHLEQVIHDLTHHEMLIDATRIIRDPKVSQAIIAANGDLVYGQMANALQDIATGAAPAKNIMDRAANFMRTGTQLSMLGWNFWTSVQQPLGLFNGASRIGGTWVARGMTRWLRDAAHMESTTKWIADVSPMMRERIVTGSQDLHDLRASIRQPGGWFDTLVRRVSADHLTQQTIVDGYMWHIGLAQRIADVPTWLGMYEKAMAHALEERTPAEHESRAIALADQAVLDSQGGGQVKDLAQVQRGGPIAKLFMTFYSYGNTIFNATADRAGATNFRSPAEVLTFMGHLSLLYMLPALGTVTASRLLGRSGGEKDDAGNFLADWGREALSSGLNTMVLARELSGALTSGTRGYAGPAGARAIELLYNVANQVKQGEADEALFKALNAAAGVLFRYPALQVQRTIDGFVALEEGRTKNPAALLVGAPPKNSRK